MTAREFLLKRFPTNEYFDCPVPKQYWEIMEEYAKAYNESEVKKLNIPAVSISLPSDIQLAILCTVADAYLYEGLYEDLHIGGKGIIRVIEEWEAMKKRQ